MSASSLLRAACLALVAVSFRLPAAAVAEDAAPTPIEPEAVALGRPVDYSRDIAPIFEANCIACHNLAIDESGLSLEGVDAILKGGDRGVAIAPGKPDESLLLTLASHRDEPVMPPADNDVKAKTLSPHELGLIRQWILEGAGKGQGGDPNAIAWRPLPNRLIAIRSVAVSPDARFVVVGRRNQIELYDLSLGASAASLVDPNLSPLSGDGGPLYPAGAAHRDFVNALAFAPDGNMLASGDYRAVKLWKRSGLGNARSIDLPGTSVCAVSPDGTTAAIVVGNDVRLVTLADGAVTSQWTIEAPPLAIAFSTDGQRIAVVCEDKTLRSWLLTESQPQPPRSFDSAATSVAFSGDRLATGHEDGQIRVWPAGGSEPERSLPGHAGPIRALAAISGQSNGLVSGGADGTIRVWDAASGTAIRSINHGASVVDVAVSPDGRSVASCGVDGSLRIHELADGKKLAEQVGPIAIRRAERQASERLEWRKLRAQASQSRRTEAEAAVKEREEMVKKAEEAKVAAVKAAAEAKTAAEAASVAAKAADEQAMAKADDAELKKNATEAAAKVQETVRLATTAEEAVRSADRGMALAAGGLKAARERLETRQRDDDVADASVATAEAEAAVAKTAAAQPVAATAVAFSRDGLRLVAAFADASVETFAASGQPLDTVVLDGVGADLAFTADGMASALVSDRGLRNIDVLGRWEYAGVLGPPHDAPLDVSKSTIADRVLALSFSPDGKRLATGGGEPSRGGALVIWNVETRSMVRSFTEPHSDTVQAVAYSREGGLLATAAADKFAKTFDPETGELRKAFEGHTDHVLGVAVRADGTEVVTASADTSIKVWDVETAEQRKTVAGHAKQVTAVRYLGLTDEIVSGGGDRTVRIHRTSDGKQVRTFAGPADYIHAVDASADGSTIVAGGEEGVLFVWDAKSEKPRRTFAPPQAETASR